MVNFRRKQQQPTPPSVILVVLIAGFALLPAGSVAELVYAEAKVVVEQLRSSACASSFDSSKLRMCVIEFRRVEAVYAACG